MSSYLDSFQFHHLIVEMSTFVESPAEDFILAAPPAVVAWEDGSTRLDVSLQSLQFHCRRRRSRRQRRSSVGGSLASLRNTRTSFNIVVFLPVCRRVRMISNRARSCSRSGRWSCSRGDDSGSGSRWSGAGIRRVVRRLRLCALK